MKSYALPLAVVLTLGLGACSASHPPPAVGSPWTMIALGAGARQLLVASPPQDTTDQTSPCFVHYTATADTSGPTIVIRVTSPRPAVDGPGGVACDAKAVAGVRPIAVDLPADYAGQPLIDGYSGLVHVLRSSPVIAQLPAV